MFESAHSPIIREHITACWQLWHPICKSHKNTKWWTSLHIACRPYIPDRDTLKDGPGGMRLLSGWCLWAHTRVLQSDCTHHPLGHPLYSDGFIPGPRPRRKKKADFLRRWPAVVFIQPSRTETGKFICINCVLAALCGGGWRQPSPPAGSLTQT